MRKVYQMVEQAAPTQASMLICGESGTGKELVAQTMHQLSPRDGQAVRPAQLRRDSRTRCSKARLFGHERGAFTGAITAARAASSWPTAAPCSSTKSPR